MKTLVSAFFIGLLAIVSVYFALWTIGIESSVAGTVAATFVGGIPYVRETLEKQALILKTGSTAAVLSLGEFGLAPQRLVLYGCLIIMASMAFASAVAGVGAIALGQEFTPAAVLIPAMLVVYPTIFLTARWVGRRALKQGLFCVLLIVVLSRVGATLLDFVTMGAEETKLFYAPLFNDRTFWEAVLQVLVGMTALLLTAALGYWRGTHQRFATYLNYLLKNVPEATRHVIVELAVDEARRAGAEQGPIAERVLPAGSRPQFAK